MKMKAKPEKFYQESSTGNRASDDGCVNGCIVLTERKTASTLQGKTRRKNEIIITREQRKEASWLIKQAGYPAPAWLRQQFIANRERRSLINKVWKDAGLDGDFCYLVCRDDGWSGLVHQLWHQVNGVPPCK